MSSSIQWPQTAAEAIALQKEFRHKVIRENKFGRIGTVAGVDVSHNRFVETSRAAIALMDWETLELRASSIAFAPLTFPYIPGLLSFREIPVILEALSCLPEKPDLLMVDGHGIAHPRRLGVAAHLGALLDIPSIGIGKSRLTGKHETLPAAPGSTVPLMDKDEMIGTLLRSKRRSNPLYVSTGHRVDQETALAFARRCLKGYRLPEPTRIADILSKTKKLPA
jgi:deoxyribonuclease V